MALAYEKIIEIMDANAGYLSLDTPENLYKFLNSLTKSYRGPIMQFCHNDLKYPILDKLEKLPGFIFHDWNTNFNTWTASSHVVQIDSYVFGECKLDVVDLSNAKITELSNGAFLFTSIKKVILPEGLKKIGLETFAVSDIEELYIPSTVESIGKDSFKNCPKLQKVHLCRNSIAQNKLVITQDDLNIIKPAVVLY